MRGVEGEVEIERFVRTLGLMYFTASPMSWVGVAFSFTGLLLREPIKHARVTVRVIIQFADHRAVLVIEAALLGPILRVA